MRKFAEILHMFEKVVGKENLSTTYSNTQSPESEVRMLSTTPQYSAVVEKKSFFLLFQVKFACRSEHDNKTKPVT